MIKFESFETLPLTTCEQKPCKLLNNVFGVAYIPKQELMKPYHMQPCLPSSHRPRTLDAKLRVVPNKHTSMSLTLMLRSSMLTGVLSVLNLQKRTKTTKLLRKPKVMMNPRNTDRAMKPARESVSTGESLQSPSRRVNRSSSLMLKL